MAFVRASTRRRRWCTSRRSATRTKAVRCPSWSRAGKRRFTRRGAKSGLDARLPAGQHPRRRGRRQGSAADAAARAVARAACALAERMVLLIAPILQRRRQRARRAGASGPLQNGPLGGVGQRPNAQDLDLNRDHMKLESPEARSLVRLLRDYDPHLVVDLHTTNGTYHAYHLTYSPPLHPDTAPAIVDGCAATGCRRSRARSRRRTDGTSTTTATSRSKARRSSAAGTRSITVPRFDNNYLGLRNRFAILSEAYAYCRSTSASR